MIIQCSSDVKNELDQYEPTLTYNDKIKKLLKIARAKAEEEASKSFHPLL